jgi:hypothetical protein
LNLQEQRSEDDSITKHQNMMSILPGGTEGTIHSAWEGELKEKMCHSCHIVSKVAMNSGTETFHCVGLWARPGQDHAQLSTGCVPKPYKWTESKSSALDEQTLKPANTFHSTTPNF